MGMLLNISEKIETSVRMAIEEGIAEALEEIEQKAVSELREKIHEIVAGVAVKCASHVMFERLGRELVIHVRMEK